MKPEQEFSQNLKRVLNNPANFTPLHEPCFQGDEAKLVLDCIESGWVSSVGAYVDEFEESLAKFCGVKRAVAVVNGTAALHVCLVLAGVEPGDEVIMPSLTFVASANAANMAGAFPNFVDVEKDTLGIDPIKLGLYLNKIGERRAGGFFNKQSNRRIAAIVPMHTLGHPVKLHELAVVAEQFSIPIVEDAAESLGSYYKGNHTGSVGLLSAVSFNGNKIITTGGGGAILTNDDRLADQAKHLTTTAKSPHRWHFSHDQRGFNYRMPNINAALGVAQLEQLPRFLKAKRALAEAYRSIFVESESFQWIDEPMNCKSNFWLCALQLKGKASKSLESVLQASNDAGLMTRPLWKPLHTLEIYAGSVCDNLEVTSELSDTLICVPSGANLRGFN